MEYLYTTSQNIIKKASDSTDELDVSIFGEVLKLSDTFSKLNTILEDGGHFYDNEENEDGVTVAQTPGSFSMLANNLVDNFVGQLEKERKASVGLRFLKDVNTIRLLKSISKIRVSITQPKYQQKCDAVIDDLKKDLASLNGQLISSLEGPK